MNKPVKITLITTGTIFGFIFALLLIVRLFGGMIAQAVVENNDTNWLHREIKLDIPTINPFNTSVRLTNVCLYEEDGRKEFVRFDTLYAQINALKLLKKEVFLEHAWLNGLQATVINRDTCFNFQDIIEHFSSDEEDEDTESIEEEPESETIEKDNASPWGISLKDIRIHRGQIAYVDAKRASKFAVENININVPEVHLGKDQTEAGLSFDFPDNQGSMRIMAHVDQESGAYDLQVGIDTIGLDIAIPFIKEYAHVSQLGSRLSGQIQAAGTLQTITQSAIKGRLTLADTHILDDNRQDILSLGCASVDVENIDLANMNFVLNEVNLSDLHTTYEQWEGENTISKLLKEEARAETTQAEEIEEKEEAEETEEKGEVEEDAGKEEIKNAEREKAPLNFLVKKVDISRINLTYKDHTLASPFEYTVTDLSVQTHDLTPNGSNDIRLKANLNQAGSLEAAWKGGLNLHKGQETISLTVKNLQVADFSPWCEAYTATPISAGSLSLMAEERLHEGMLRGTNKVDIYGMVADPKISPSDAPYKAIPIRLAIGVLEDFDHKIEISLPISGDINNPQFSLSKIIWKTVGNVLLKATASPWVALGKAMGMGSEDMEKIDISTLQIDFTSEQYSKVDQLVEMMRQQEELTLCLTQQFNMADAIAQQREFAIKRRYYEHRFGAIETPTLADIEDIRNIKTTSADYKEWLSEQATADEETINKEAAAAVMQFAATRQRLLSDYLTKQQGLPAGRVKVETANEEALLSFKGKAQFTISAEAISIEL